MQLTRDMFLLLCQLFCCYCLLCPALNSMFFHIFSLLCLPSFFVARRSTWMHLQLVSPAVCSQFDDERGLAVVVVEIECKFPVTTYCCEYTSAGWTAYMFEILYIILLIGVFREYWILNFFLEKLFRKCKFKMNTFLKIGWHKK